MGKHGARPGVLNPNWRGGKTIGSNGYVKVLVGTGHHLADSKGYAYEHRLLAEKKLGRRLLHNEVVHHADANRENNSVDNLVVYSSAAEHHVEHRSVGKGRRLPNEPNVPIQCACGCRTTLLKYDDEGRPRLFVSGHNPHPAPSVNAVVEAVISGHIFTHDIEGATGLTRPACLGALSKAVKAGRLARRGRGAYGLPGATPLKAQRVVRCACGCGTRFELYDAFSRKRSYVSGHNMRRAV